MGSFKICMPCLTARNWVTAQPERGSDGEHLYYFGQLKEDLSYLAPEIKSQGGRRFHAYRLQVLVSRRRLFAQALRKAG
ncbi:hypothetical protein [Pseudomonas sp. YuFO8]|uniref:hypothetical protein n=1 Tax=Pseudomonas sp. YuFO8 TaxID=3095361 RepID=UPI002B2420FF|nr:hypothetical protein [Pseudomonas sp. YuFO8]MEB2621454.1 hypothetical protein [Pseudomonas sp. YuFO8]